MSMLLKSIASIAVLMCVSSVLLLAAESQSTKPIPKKQWGKPTEGFQISASTDKETYDVCEAINLTLILKNSGKGDAETWSALVFDQTYRVEVILPTKKKAPLTLWGKRQSDLGIMQRAVTTLKENKTETKSIPRLNQLFDMSIPGEYTIVVERTLSPRADGTKYCRVTSNTVVVKITED